MPIRPEERDRYPADWPAISLRIREREGNRCKWCGVPNETTIVRTGDGPGEWLVHECDGACLDEPCPAILIVLTVAHLDHVPENCSDENLAALCQRCHNRYDAPMRRAGREQRAGVLRLPLEA